MPVVLDVDAAGLARARKARAKPDVGDLAPAPSLLWTAHDVDR